jgi:hypothetical protein
MSTINPSLAALVRPLSSLRLHDRNADESAYSGQPTRLLGCQMLGLVLFQVFCLGQTGEVFNRVVQRVAVSMVDHHATLERTTMVTPDLPGAQDPPVRLGDLNVGTLEAALPGLPDSDRPDRDLVRRDPSRLELTLRREMDAIQVSIPGRMTTREPRRCCALPRTEDALAAQMRWCSVEALAAGLADDLDSPVPAAPGAGRTSAVSKPVFLHIETLAASWTGGRLHAMILQPEPLLGNRWERFVGNGAKAEKIGHFDQAGKAQPVSAEPGEDDASPS